MEDQALRNTLQILLISVAEFVRLWSKDCEDLPQFRKEFSQDEPEFCQILN